jgi:hypothetical protein
MKNCTKFSMILLISLFCIQTNAQTFGLKAGLNLSNMLEKDDDDTYSNDYKMNPGFHIGGTVDVPISDILSFESGLLLTTKGFKYEEEEMGISIKAKANLYYLDIPLTLKASHELSEGLKIFGAVGPYVGIGLSGKIKATVEYQGDEETDEEDVKWGSDEDNDDLKRLDMGLTFGGGVEINAIMLGISYDLGLANISSYQQDGATSKNKVLKFSVGYRF